MIERLKLLKITYSYNGKSGSYAYHFEGGVTVNKPFVFPFTRLNNKIWVFTIPLLKFRFLLIEFIAFLLMAVAGTLAILKIRHMMHSSEYSVSDVVVAKIQALFFVAMTYALFTKMPAEILTHRFGKKVTGTIIKREEYINKGSEYNRICDRHTIEIPGGTQVVIDDFTRGEYLISDSIQLYMHPDEVPFVIYYRFMKIYFPFIILAAIGIGCSVSFLKDAVQHGFWL
jgi:hypothetical protein